MTNNVDLDGVAHYELLDLDMFSNLASIIFVALKAKHTTEKKQT